MRKNTKYRNLPKEVMSWLLLEGAWLVGSGAAWYVGDSAKQPKDYDVLISPERLPNALLHARAAGGTLGYTSFGGLRAILNRSVIDFWPMGLETFIGLYAVDRVSKPQVAFRFRPRTILRWGDR